MKFQLIICYALIQLAIGFVTKSIVDEDQSYYILKTKDGEVIKGNMAEFNEILRRFNNDLETSPEYENILEEGYTKMNNDMKAVPTNEANALEMQLIVSNSIADMYEKIFAAAGMDLKIYNRKPYVFQP